MKQIIGIDFDNTIISYHSVFHVLARAQNWIPEDFVKSKDAIKQLLIQEDGNDLRWQLLQAEAYGPSITQASPFEGCKEFIDGAHKLGCRIVIISHKTEHSNFDPSVPLRKWARVWLSLNHLGIPEQDIYFVSSPEEKIAKMKELGCTIFIDDLLSVLKHRDFPEAVQKIWLMDQELPERRLLGASGIFQALDWKEIGVLFRLFTEGHPQLPQLLNELWDKHFSKYDAVKASGNNKVFKIGFAGGPDIIVKRSYAESSNEFEAMSLLWKNGFREIPEPIHYDASMHCSVYSQLKGRVLSGNEINDTHIAQVGRFLSRLHTFSHQPQNTFERNAVDSRQCLNDYVKKIIDRLNKIEEGCSSVPHGEEVRDLLDESILPLWGKILSRFKASVLNLSLDPQILFSRTERMLSPSDFGFHNMLVDEAGQVRYLDFEYFGWDDPCKLFADFFHSVAHDVSWQHRWSLLDYFSRSLSNPVPFLRRWETIVDLVGLEWILIVLNVASAKVMERKKFADSSIQPEILIKARLQKARSMISFIESLGESGTFLTMPERMGREET